MAIHKITAAHLYVLTIFETTIIFLKGVISRGFSSKLYLLRGHQVLKFYLIGRFYFQNLTA